MAVFRIINGVPLSRDEWLAVMDASRAADAALDGYDYGNLMESRMVLDEMAADGDAGAIRDLANIDALLSRYEAARNAALNAAVNRYRRAS